MVSKQVVGWHVMATMPEELSTTALQRAFWAQPPTPGLRVHSDRGGQYCGNVYRKLLHDHGALRSQSRRGDCYDNAQAENRLKVFVFLVTPQNGSTRRSRAARFCRPSRRTAQRGRLF